MRLYQWDFMSCGFYSNNTRFLATVRFSVTILRNIRPIVIYYGCHKMTLRSLHKPSQIIFFVVVHLLRLATCIKNGEK